MAKFTTIDEIITGAKKYLPKLDENRVLRAYEFAKKAHEGQTRSSGEAYIHHPMEVTKILLSLKPDEDSIVASLMHDVLEDTGATIEEIEKEFGPSVVPLLKGLEKLSTVYYRGKERQVENLRKMFLAMAKDIRVILIKLSDRLHNMRTLDSVREDKRVRIAEETLSIYSPIAARLGIYEIKDEMDDLGFSYVHPAEYDRIKKELAEFHGKQDKMMSAAKRVLFQTLKKSNIEARVEGRVKNPYSIYKKLKRKGKNYLSELYDIFALRVIVADEAQCYQALGAIHKHYTPLSHRFKDYIGHAKPNGYQSLHTTLIGLVPELNNQPIEVQIRSEEMDEIAKFGIAAHWQYKDEGGRSIAVPEDKLIWVQGLVDLHESLTSNSEFIESLNVDIFRDRIFVLTPKGDVKDLPHGATPIDFAYAVHTEVGNRCKGVKVNGQIVPLNSALKSGDVVEVITSQNTQPNRYWLSFVLTSHAKSSIKQWFNALDRDKIIRIGKDMINAQLKRFNQPLLDPSYSILKEYEGKKMPLREREQLIEKIGNGSVNVSTVIRKLVPMENLIKPITDEKVQREVLSGGVKIEEHAEVLITGEKGLQTFIATCCSPKPNDEIVGYITRGRGITIHKQKCKVLKGNDQNRLIRANWSTQKSTDYTVRLAITRHSRIGLLRDVAAVFAANDLNIVDIHNLHEVGENKGDMVVTTSIDSIDTLSKIIDELEMVPGVISVKEFSGKA